MDIHKEIIKQYNRYETTPNKTLPWSQTHMNRNTDKNYDYEVYLQITSRFGLAKAIVSVKRTGVLENNSEILTVSSPFTLFHMFWIKFSTMVKHSSVTGVLELSGVPTTYLDLDRVRLTLLLICKQNDSFWQLTLKRLSRARAQDKTKQYYCYFFFFLQDFIQLCDSRIRIISTSIITPFVWESAPRGSALLSIREKNTCLLDETGSFIYCHLLKV